MSAKLTPWRNNTHTPLSHSSKIFTEDGLKGTFFPRKSYLNSFRSFFFLFGGLEQDQASSLRVNVRS